MIAINVARLSDVGWLAELQSGPEFRRWISSTPPIAELRAEIRAKLLQVEDDGGRFVVARWSGSPAGYGAVYLSQCRQRGHVEVGVDPGHFRKGIGAAVMDALVRYKRAAQVQQLQAVVDARNAACIALLQSRGFTEGAAGPRPGLLRLVLDTGN